MFDFQSKDFLCNAIVDFARYLKLRENNPGPLLAGSILDGEICKAIGSDCKIWIDVIKERKAKRRMA